MPERRDERRGPGTPDRRATAWPVSLPTAIGVEGRLAGPPLPLVHRTDQPVPSRRHLAARVCPGSDHGARIGRSNQRAEPEGRRPDKRLLLRPPISRRVRAWARETASLSIRMRISRPSSSTTSPRPCSRSTALRNSVGMLRRPVPETRPRMTFMVRLCDAPCR